MLYSNTIGVQTIEGTCGFIQALFAAFSFSAEPIVIFWKAHTPPCELFPIILPQKMMNSLTPSLSSSALP